MSTSTPDAKGTQVFLFREREAYRRLHEGILIESAGGPEPARLFFEIESVEPRSLVDHVLAVTAFSGGDPRSGVRAARIEPGAVDWVKIMGFRVPDALVPVVLEEVQNGLVSGIGGFSEIVLAQGFHHSPYVFKHLWEVAGCPPTTLLAPEMVLGRFDPRRPTSIGQHTDRSILASMMRSGLPIPEASE